MGLIIVDSRDFTMETLSAKHCMGYLRNSFLLLQVLCENDFIKADELKSIYEHIPSTLRAEYVHVSPLSIAHFVHGILGEHEFASKTPDPFIRRFETNWKLLDQILKDTKANGVSRCKLQTVLMKFISRLPLMFQKKDESGLWLADIPKEPWNPTTSNILPFWKRYPVHPRMLSLWRNGQLHINWKLFSFEFMTLIAVSWRLSMLSSIILNLWKCFILYVIDFISSTSLPQRQ